jgi:hypothetical protein
VYGECVCVGGGGGVSVSEGFILSPISRNALRRKAVRASQCTAVSGHQSRNRVSGTDVGRRRGGLGSQPLLRWSSSLSSDNQQWHDHPGYAFSPNKNDLHRRKRGLPAPPTSLKVRLPAPKEVARESSSKGKGCSIRLRNVHQSVHGGVPASLSHRGEPPPHQLAQKERVGSGTTN